MAVNYTTEQREAIETLDKSILVSAAAGSGKTAVLIQRIINIILKGEADVDEMLVVTFTNAAAAEMRVKLGREIKKRMQEDGADKVKLSAQLDKLYRAYISTFNSFAIRIIREFFYEVDIEPDFRVCDEVSGTMLQLQAVDSLFEEAFEKDDLIEGGSFRQFLRLYSNDRNENRIKEDIIAAYGKLRTMPDYFQWAHNIAELLNNDADTIRGSALESCIMDSFRRMTGEVLRDMYSVRRMYYDAGIGELYEAKLLPELERMEDIVSASADTALGTELQSLIEGMEFAKLSNVAARYKDSYNLIKEDVKALRDRYKKNFNEWLGKFFSPDFETRLAEMKASYEYTEYFIRILENFEERYSALKKEQGMMDFSDMEHTAARILKNDEVAETLRKRFKFIFVDEYQDTNNIQESLIGRVSRDNNVFKVGDVKQSIYRFRQAEPAIFERTYKSYKAEENTSAKAIDLNKNFRCNGRTVAYINRIFEDAMEGYDEAAKLHVGVANCPDEYDMIPELHLLVSEKNSSNEEDVPDELMGTGADGELRELSRDEAEAEYVAGIINNLIGTDFFDTAAGELRKVEARDIVILLRGTKYRGELYARALRNLELQSHIEEESEYFDSIEIKVAISMLMAIDNFKRDIPLIATLHSEVFGFGADELGIIRAEHKQFLRDSRQPDRKGIPYWRAVKWYASYGSIDELRERTGNAIAKLEHWRELASMMPLEDFIWRLLTESNYYMYAGAMYGGSRRQANLRTLADRAAKFTEFAVASLGDYIAYLEVMRSKKIKSGQASMVSKDDNVIRISTIHKSKGLEYPFVIVAGMGSRLKKDTNSKGFMFDTEMGVGLPYVDPDKRYWRSTILQRAVLDKSDRDSANEELRILYVAMTRARNKLVLVGTIDEGEEEKLKNGLYNKNTYLGVIGHNISTPLCRLHIRPLETEGRWDKRSRARDVIEACSRSIPESQIGEYNELYREVSRRLEYVYPGKRLKYKAKYSVSEIRREIAEEVKMSENGSSDEEVVAIVRNANAKKRRASSADIGIAYHRIMEYVDFTRVWAGDDADMEYIRACADSLCEKGAIDEAAYKAVDLGHIAEFFRSDLGRRAIAASTAGKLKKEKPFTLTHDKDGQSVLVQGVIDCCFEEDGEMVLIDYKSSFVRKGIGHIREVARIRREYAPQIELYGEALRAGTGKNLKEAYLYLFLSDEAVRIEEDESEAAKGKLGRLCEKAGLSNLPDMNLSGKPAESRKLIEAFNAVAAEYISGAAENPYDKWGPSPDDEIWCELSMLVRKAFPKGFAKAEDRELARMVHQLRYVISAQQVEYVRHKYPAATDEDSLAAYFSTLDGAWSLKESDRLHNKMIVDSKETLGGRYPNIKLVCGDFHSEFILDSDGRFLYILNPKGTLNDVINGSSFNYAEGNDLWLDGEENPFSVHGLLDVHIQVLDPEFRRTKMKGFSSPSLIEYNLKGGKATSALRKKSFAKKVGGKDGGNDDSRI
ncbi:MAG: UvrD-helicase domain-containing protein [Clostridiales bacterium]|nr:UvrD-helicase domain-containing protein [Candidatus Crickella merdequi]